MNKYQHAAISIAFLTVLLTAGTCSGITRSTDDPDNDANTSRQEAILETFENNDYDSWKKLVGRKDGIKNIIDENDFRAFVTARKIARAGDYDRAIGLTQKLERKLKEKMGAYFA